MADIYLTGIKKDAERDKQFESSMKEEIMQLKHKLTVSEKMQQENNDKINSLLSLIAKEAILGKPVIPKSQLDLIFSDKLDSIPFPVADGDGKDIKQFTIGKKLESIRRNYAEESKRFKDKKTTMTPGKAEVIFLEPPDSKFLTKEQQEYGEEYIRNHKQK